MKHADGATSGSSSVGPGRGALDVEGRLAEIDRLLGDLAAELVPERIPGHRLNRVVKALGRIERRAAGCRLVLAKAAADTGAWKAAGAKSPAEHAAKEQGISVGEAKADLDASAKLEKLPLARDATASGDLSAAKAKAVAQGAAADPAAEAKLVATARTGDLLDTRDEARKAIQRADERSGGAGARHVRRRALRTWVSLDGEGHGQWNVPAEYQARFLAALEPYRREAFRRAREAGRRETHEALMADAMDLLARDVLLDDGHDPDEPFAPRRAGPTSPTGPINSNPALADADSTDTAGPIDPAGSTSPTDRTGSTGPTDPAGSNPAGADARPTTASVRPGAGGRPRAPRSDKRNRRAPAQVHVHVDFDTLRRGHAEDGERCEIDGIGPIPVTLAKAILDDAMLRLVVTGTDIKLVSSHRRYIPQALRTAVTARDRTCVVPGCHATHGLEIDHWQRDFARKGPTAEANLAALCRYHHLLKTHCGWTLTGGPDHWTFSPLPDDPDPP